MDITVHNNLLFTVLYLFWIGRVSEIFQKAIQGFNKGF